ncbi:hypothetical protein CEXT_467261 [Caerostris extrusa]|uniref:Uncharacterized protein n=1 Tax=Caerostris extrusa TaxID=172846 RepID=A0AAV4X3N3_CAEEX|nr:hypothetical protein CEXT_467261 [Caerostris extrusa]
MAKTIKKKRQRVAKAEAKLSLNALMTLSIAGADEVIHLNNKSRVTRGKNTFHIPPKHFSRATSLSLSHHICAGTLSPNGIVRNFGESMWINEKFRN